MTEVLDRGAEPAGATPGSPTHVDAVDTATDRLELADRLRYLFAALSGAAGVIHLAMVPSHVDEWALEGAAFALAGWAQVAMALLALTRPSRRLLVTTIACNLIFVGAWAVTRTAGWPFGPHAGHAESASLVDVSAVGMEVALVVMVGLILARPDRARPDRAPFDSRLGRLLAPGAPVTILVLVTAVLASPSARDHANDSHGGHEEEAATADEAATGHVHDGDQTGVESVAADTAAPDSDDRGLSQLRNGHQHEAVEQELDEATQAELDEQLAVTRDLAAEYPTLADAKAAGFTRIGPYFPGLGAHYRYPGMGTNTTGEMDREALLGPMAFIYDGNEPTSRVAGFMYLADTDTEPEGFAGDNDVWHNHQQLCLEYLRNGEINVPFGLDNQSTAAQCEAAGGEILPISPWMVHVWSAPGYDDDPDVPVFHELHTDLTCADGTYHMLPLEDWVDHQLDVCRAGAA